MAVPLNFRYSGEEIKYCLELADVEALVFGPEGDRRGAGGAEAHQAETVLCIGGLVPAYQNAGPTVLPTSCSGLCLSFL